MLDKVKRNQILIAILGVIILTVLVIGITYAGFSQTAYTGNNSISSGTISMSFQEPSNNVVITNAMPTSNGYSSTTHFDFSVSGSAKAQITLPYEITITEKSGNTLAASNVRIGLKKNGSIVTGFESGKLASTLTSSTVRSGSKTLYKDGLVLAQSGSNYTKTDNYQLFLWIDSSAVLPNDGTTKYYSVLVNINSTVGALGTGPTEVYAVSRTVMHIGSALPNGVNGRSTPELAMQDWVAIAGSTKPYYLKHILNSSNEIEESYVEFVVTEDMENANPGMVAGTYSLKGGDSGASYTTNVDTLKAAFGYSTNPGICMSGSGFFSCSVFGLYAHVGDDGYVSADGTDYYYCRVYYDGSSDCSGL